MASLPSQAVHADPSSSTAGPSSLPPSLSPAPVLRPASFYQRVLPSSCVSFTSSNGKALFSSALQDGTLEAFFPLSSQWITQNEVSWCGLACLTMILNALGIDPQRNWKGPWRFYNETLLDCCRPIDSIKEDGLTFDEVTCLARCNGLAVETYRPPSTTPTEQQRRQGIEKLRRDLRRATTTSSCFMAVSYSRRTLGQTGDGHFSPIGAYDAQSDSALILDVARFKYPAHWVSVSLLWDSLVPVDKSTGKSRGYALLSPLIPTRSNVDSDAPAIPLNKTSLTLHKASWSDLGRALTAAVLALPRDATAKDVIDKVAKVVAARPMAPVGLRSGETLFSSPPPSGDPASALQEVAPDTLQALFLLALFSPQDGGGALASVMDPLMRNDMAKLLQKVEGRLDEETRREVDGLRRQIQALGECCASEGKECGCASAAGKR